ncbi:unnamed protein product [Paramecium sonneborni]|uniref:Uncharacterized protein n=1 Tax=Paramecium sonneborni TaxID=65129 RepID=A0A8S1LX89_9CILI|nr:unnamed protein product [Paramecium sonneborni]
MKSFLNNQQSEVQTLNTSLFQKRQQYFQELFLMIYSFYNSQHELFLAQTQPNSSLRKELLKEKQQNYGDETYQEYKIMEYLNSKQLQMNHNCQKNLIIFEHFYSLNEINKDLQLDCQEFSIKKNFSGLKYNIFNNIKLDDHPTRNSEHQIQGRTDGLYLLKRLFIDQKLNDNSSNKNFLSFLISITKEHEKEQMQMQSESKFQQKQQLQQKQQQQFQQQQQQQQFQQYQLNQELQYQYIKQEQQQLYQQQHVQQQQEQQQQQQELSQQQQQQSRLNQINNLNDVLQYDDVSFDFQNHNIQQREDFILDQYQSEQQNQSVQNQEKMKTDEQKSNFCSLM